MAGFSGVYRFCFSKIHFVKVISSSMKSVAARQAEKTFQGDLLLISIKLLNFPIHYPHEIEFVYSQNPSLSFVFFVFSMI